MSKADQVELDRKALEALVVNNADLERLEALLDRFNIFVEAVGLIRQEIRHSAFLAFLLDPRESHGLGDGFSRRLFQEAIMSAPHTSAPVTPIELSLWDLGQMEVRREWQHIDIFLLDERNRLAVIIENKIDTVEHSDQLPRYYEIVKRRYAGYRIIGLYLTPAGDEPSHDVYLPLAWIIHGAFFNWRPIRGESGGDRAKARSQRHCQLKSLEHGFPLFTGRTHSRE